MLFSYFFIDSSLVNKTYNHIMQLPDVLAKIIIL